MTEAGGRIWRRAEKGHQRITRQQAFHTTARLVAIYWARQLRDGGEPAPPLRILTAQILREVRR